MWLLVKLLLVQQVILAVPGCQSEWLHVFKAYPAGRTTWKKLLMAYRKCFLSSLMPARCVLVILVLKPIHVHAHTLLPPLPATCILYFLLFMLVFGWNRINIVCEFWTHRKSFWDRSDNLSLGHSVPFFLVSRMCYSDCHCEIWVELLYLRNVVCEKFGCWLLLVSVMLVSSHLHVCWYFLPGDGGRVDTVV